MLIKSEKSKKRYRKPKNLKRQSFQINLDHQNLITIEDISTIISTCKS